MWNLSFKFRGQKIENIESAENLEEIKNQEVLEVISVS